MRTTVAPARRALPRATPRSAPSKENGSRMAVANGLPLVRELSTPLSAAPDGVTAPALPPSIPKEVADARASVQLTIPRTRTKRTIVVTTSANHTHAGYKGAATRGG